MNIKRFPLGPLWTNGYLVWDSDGRGFFVDPGGPMGEVIEFIKNANIGLEMVLLTHGHSDHIFGLEEIRPLAKKGVGIHELDAPLLEKPELNLSAFLSKPCAAKPAEQKLQDGQVLEIGSMRVEVIHTPGHTRGSCCLMANDEDEAILLSGDTLFAQSIGRTDLPGGDQRELECSLKKLARLKDDMQVFPGHGPDTTIGAERINNPFWPMEKERP